MSKHDEPLLTGFHPPEQCARGRVDCQSLAQVISTNGEPRTFICCGEVLDNATPRAQDQWALCVKGYNSDDCVGTDMRIFCDRRDLSHIAAVTAMGLAMVIPLDEQVKGGA